MKCIYHFRHVNKAPCQSANLPIKHTDSSNEKSSRSNRQRSSSQDILQNSNMAAQKVSVHRFATDGTELTTIVEGETTDQRCWTKVLCTSNSWRHANTRCTSWHWNKHNTHVCWYVWWLASSCRLSKHLITGKTLYKENLCTLRLKLFCPQWHYCRLP